MKSVLISLIFLFGTVSIFAQPAPSDWMHMDNSTGFLGVSAHKTYSELLKDKEGQEVIVAVIDSGVDIDHEDLFQNIWLNIDEIPDNGIDDDKNGYIDDIHGWNFIGGADGKNVGAETLEVTRLYAALVGKYEDVDPLSLSDKEKIEYAKFLKYKKEIDEERQKAKTGLEKIQPIFSTVRTALESLSTEVNSTYISKIGLDTISSSNQMVLIGKSIFMQILTDEGVDSIDFARTVSLINMQFEEEESQYTDKLNFRYNPDYDSRKEIVKDDYNDSKQKYYGNNDVEGPDPLHGTHVAGIIAAARGNDVGMDGVAANVKIMSVRTVPDGDERDKDVANAIRYAVDNGASVINMSFGKGYSWDKNIVDDAVKYAEKKDVLIIHAAGNDGKDNDTSDNFPNDKFQKKGFFLCPKKESKTWIEVGALSYQNDGNNAAPFSNFGKENVDLFAPGMAIYSTTPNNTYQYLQGTSMASPVVAGVAAVLRSHFPELKAEQVKKILLETVTPLEVKVRRPGDGELIAFTELSKSGGYVNLFQAVKKAMVTKGKKKIKKKKVIKV